MISQKLDSKTHTDKAQSLVDSRLADVRHSPDISEEISEDAYKQNAVYQSWANISPEEDKAASERKRPLG